jgi:hypothetical protein
MERGLTMVESLRTRLMLQNGHVEDHVFMALARL